MAFSRRRDVAGDVAQALRNNRQLEQFLLTGVTPTGHVLGTGSYGSVEEVSPHLLLGYGTSLDIFSFGHLALFTITQEFPGNLLPSTFTDPDNAGNLLARNELERRERYVESLEHVGRFHPALVQLVKQCLHNVPDQRPSTDVLLTTLQRMRVEVEGEYGGSPLNVDIMMRVKQAKEMNQKDSRIEELTQRQERQEVELGVKTRQLEERRRELEAKDEQIATKDGMIQQLRNEVEELLATKDREIAVRDDRIQQLTGEVESSQLRLREELQSKEAEISRLREELRRCQASLEKRAGPVQVPLKLPLQLRWRCGPDMPFQMWGYVQSVMVQGTVYIGGGIVGGGSPNNYIVMAYDTNSRKWATLPPYRARDFAVTAVNNTPVLVGGTNRSGNNIKMVGVWRPDSKKWTHPYPDMPTPRSSCSAVTYNEWLVVAGGLDGRAALSSVEVLNTDTKQWSAGPPTPTPWDSMWPAIVGDVCYFMGGLIGNGYTNRVYSTSLPALTSQLNSGVRDSQIWMEISGLQAECSSPLSISGSLLAVGGKDKSWRILSAIHLYQPDTGEWVKVGDLPTPRYDCTCIALTNRELLVAGGTAAGGDRLQSVDIALIN